MIESAGLFFALLVAVLGLADLAWVTLRTPVTSRRLAAFGWRVSGFPFAAGVYLGRYFSAEVGPIRESYLLAAAVLVAIFWVVVTMHWALGRWLDLPSWFGLVYVPCGVPTGMFFWPV